MHSALQSHLDDCARHPQHAQLGEHLGSWRQQFAQRTQHHAQAQTQQRSLNALQTEAEQRRVQMAALTARVTAARQKKDDSALAQQNAQIAQNQRLRGQPLSALREQWQSAQGQVGTAQQLVQLGQEGRQLALRQSELTQQLQTTSAIVQEQQAQRLVLREQHTELKEQVADKQALLTQERLIRSLDQHRHALQAGQACPLCGAVEHPAIASYQALDITATEAALREKEAALARVLDLGQNLTAQLQANQAQHEALERQQGQTTQHLAQWQSAWDAALASAMRADTLQPSGIPPLTPDAWQHTDALNARHQAAAHLLAQLSADLHAAEAGEQFVQQAVAAHAQSVQALQDTEHQLALLTQAADTARASQDQLQADIATTQAAIDRATEQLHTELRAFAYTLPADPEPWLKDRQAEWQYWQDTQQRIQNLRPSITRQQAQTQAAQAQALVWTQRWNALQSLATGLDAALPNEAELQAQIQGMSEDTLSAALSESTQNIERLTQALAENEGRQAQAQDTRDQQSLARDAAAQIWLAALQASPFQDQAAFEAALLPDTQRQSLSALKDQLNQALQSADALLQAAVAKQSQLQAQALTLQTAQELDAHLAALESERTSQIEMIGAHRALLSQDEQLRSGQQALWAHIQQQTTESDLWQRLDGLIGSAKGDKFRKFAQGLTLDHLLQLANQHLTRLHGRYVLRRKKLGELELDIVDAWQGDVARDTRTLSGGESFLVSLALALALSDLVSHKTSIDSLFLDEGFGTLDGDTLEIALNALDALNASGKMIGIISHVEALKERIPAQIKVDKGGGVGHSRLTQTQAFQVLS